MANPLKIGKLGELIAKNFLTQQGLIIIEQNFNSRFGEIDLIAKENQTIIFVEVRVRNTKSFGNALESITPQKQRKIIKTALFYTQKKNYKGDFRIDAIGIENLNEIEPTITWIKNAFY